MAKVINKTAETVKALKAKGGVRIMNSAKDMDIMAAVNKHMEDVRRDYHVKDRKSQNAASTVILTA